MRTLIIGRAFQGTAGGGLILLVHVCISDLFSLRQRSLLMGFTEGIWAVAGKMYNEGMKERGGYANSCDD
jgi:MFS family permease